MTWVGIDRMLHYGLKLWRISHRCGFYCGRSWYIIHVRYPGYVCINVYIYILYIHLDLIDIVYIYICIYIYIYIIVWNISSYIYDISRIVISLSPFICLSPNRWTITGRPAAPGASWTRLRQQRRPATRPPASFWKVQERSVALGWSNIAMEDGSFVDDWPDLLKHVVSRSHC